MDLCDEKKFVDLRKKLNFNENKGIITSFSDSSGNNWVVKRKISSGTTGTVVSYRCNNSKYADVVIKYFTGGDQYAKLDAAHEIEIIDSLNKLNCKDFIKIGIKKHNNKDLVIMEEIDGDLGRLNFKIFKNQLKAFSIIVNFVVLGSLCAYRANKVFVDIKSENIGFKVCKNGRVKFTFIDFGSFYDINDKNPMTTFFINRESFQKGEFSNKVLFIYGTCITFLNLRLAVQSKDQMYDFIAYNLDYLSLEKKYRSRKGLLSLENYNKLKEKFYSFGKFNEPLIDTVFRELKKITVSVQSPGVFLQNLQKNNIY
jgi:hypothetical protein